MPERKHHLHSHYDRLTGQITGPVLDSTVIHPRSHGRARDCGCSRQGRPDALRWRMARPTAAAPHGGQRVGRHPNRAEPAKRGPAVEAAESGPAPAAPGRAQAAGLMLDPLRAAPRQQLLLAPVGPGSAAVPWCVPPGVAGQLLGRPAFPVRAYTRSSLTQECPSPYPDASASGNGAFGQPSAGRHRQQDGRQGGRGIVGRSPSLAGPAPPCRLRRYENA